MSFTADKQTLDDLNISGKYKGNSIFNLFAHTRTRGGERLLESMFRQPLSDAEAINARSAIFRSFGEKAVEFPVTKELCDEVEQYISGQESRSLTASALVVGRKRILREIASDKQYDMIHSGILSLIRFVGSLSQFFSRLDGLSGSCPYRTSIREAKQICSSAGLGQLLSDHGIARLSLGRVIRYDHLLRTTYQPQLRRLMQTLYECDVYIAVSRVAEDRQFVYALAAPFVEGENRIDIAGLHHPQLAGAVANNIRTDHGCNLIFLTGANMAGKSTFMKSFGIAIYLAHMGFPVAAKGMIFSVQDGLYTSINVADRLDLGYSHFYAEVLRVKQVAEAVSQNKNLVIIFDELFKGTNVKDAYDATVAVTAAFAENRNCAFIVSTHIVEAGQHLQQHCSNIKFVCFPTIINKGIPQYTFTLQDGISSDRHGMMIITNEGIIDILRGRTL